MLPPGAVKPGRIGAFAKMRKRGALPVDELQRIYNVSWGRTNRHSFWQSGRNAAILTFFTFFAACTDHAIRPQTSFPSRAGAVGPHHALGKGQYTSNSPYKIDSIMNFLHPHVLPLGMLEAAQINFLIAIASGILILLFLWFLVRLLRISMMLRQADQYRLTAEASGGACFELDLLSRRMSWVDTERMTLIGFERGSDPQFCRDAEQTHPDDRRALTDAFHGLAEGRKLDMQVRLRIPDESWAWFHLSAIPVHNQKHQYARAIGVLRSTNALHDLQQRLAEARRMETVGVIAGGIAHEFNNHLTPVRGYIELTMADLGPAHPSFEGLQTALDRVIYCADLVAQIQAYGRKSLLVMRPISLTELLPKAVAAGAEKNLPTNDTVRVEKEWPESIPEVLVDRGQFNQAISHLMRNAVQAMPEGGLLRVEAEEVSLNEEDCRTSPDARPGKFVTVRVRDTGHGIAPELLGRVMEPFFTTHGRARAQGMGLAMVHGMMAQHSGWMHIRTVPNGGTDVSLFFPLAEQPAEHPDLFASSAEAETTSAQPNEEKQRLLVADDEIFIRKLVQRVFQSDGWHVAHAESHDQVVRMFHSEKAAYDLVVLDLAMPGGTVEETIQSILDANPRTRVLVSSGRQKDTRIQRLTELDRVEFLQKPYAMKDLAATVKRVMAGTVDAI